MYIPDKPTRWHSRGKTSNADQYKFHPCDLQHTLHPMPTHSIYQPTEDSYSSHQCWRPTPPREYFVWWGLSNLFHYWGYSQTTPPQTNKHWVYSYSTLWSRVHIRSVAHVNIETVRDLIPISVLIVPFIVAPLQNSMPTSVKSFPYLKMAHPIINEDNFQINVLVRVDFHWTFVEDHIVQGKGPTVQTWLPFVWACFTTTAAS